MREVFNRIHELLQEQYNGAKHAHAPANSAVAAPVH
jgi:hypothetical protein